MIGEASQPTFGGRKFYERRIVDARVVIGLGFASHGAQKLFGWLGGGGIGGRRLLRKHRISAGRSICIGCRIG
jgi:hypothetical protein